LFQKVAQAFPGGDISAALLLEAGDEKVGNGLLEVVIALVAGLIFEADDGDRVLDLRRGGRFFVRDDVLKKDGPRGQHDDSG
jgi:hypothetical protein